MSEIVSMETIREQYSGEWVLIAYTDLDEEMRVIRGEVLAHSSDRDEIYRQLLRLKGRKVAVEYMGKVPEDLAVVL
jgi:hypothetical protein